MLHRSKTSKIVKLMCLSVTLIQLLSSPLMASYKEDQTDEKENQPSRSREISDKENFTKAQKLNFKDFKFKEEDFKQSFHDSACVIGSALLAIHQNDNLCDLFDKGLLDNIREKDKAFFIRIKLPTKPLTYRYEKIDEEKLKKNSNSLYPFKSDLLNVIGYYILQSLKYDNIKYNESNLNLIEHDTYLLHQIPGQRPDLEEHQLIDYLFNKPFKVIDTNDENINFNNFKNNGTLVYKDKTFKDFFISASFGTGHAYSIFFKDNKWLIFDNQAGKTFGKSDFVKFYQKNLENFESRAQLEATIKLEEYVSLKSCEGFFKGIYEACYQTLFTTFYEQSLKQISFTLIGNPEDSNRNKEVSRKRT